MHSKVIWRQQIGAPGRRVHTTDRRLSLCICDPTTSARKTMVMMQAQEASISQATGCLPRAKQSEANLPAPPSAQPQASQTDRLDALTQQVQDLIVVVRGLQEQGFAAMHEPSQPPPHVEGHVASPLHQGRTPPEASHHSPPRPRHRKTSKRQRSLSRHSDRSYRRRGEKEPRRVHSLHRQPFPSSSSDFSKEDTNRKTVLGIMYTRYETNS